MGKQTPRSSRFGWRLLATMTMAAGLALMTTGAAFGQSLTGGCSGTVNGRSPQSMTSDDPLQVEKGGTVTVSGSVPSSVASLPRNQIRSKTTIKVAIIEGILEPTIKTVSSKGPSWGGAAQVPKAISDFAPGVYKVFGNAKGTPGWGCSGSGYIELKGGPATPAAGAGALLAAGGAGMTLSARGRKKKDGAADPEVRAAVERSAGRDAVDLIKSVVADAKANGTMDVGLIFIVVLFVILVLIGAIDIPGALLVPVLAAMPDGPADRRTKVRVKGRPVRGFVGGLIFGVGLALLFQQLDLWVLDIGSAIIVPAVAAVAGAIRGGLGRSYLVELEGGSGAAPAAAES